MADQSHSQKTENAAPALTSHGAKYEAAHFPCSFSQTRQKFKSIDKRQVLDAVNADVRAFVLSLLPKAVITGKEARVGNVNGDAGTSLVITLTGDGCGLYFDHANANKGDLIQLYMDVKGVDFQTSLKDLAIRYGLQSDVRKTKVKHLHTDKGRNLKDISVSNANEGQKTQRETKVNNRPQRIWEEAVTASSSLVEHYLNETRQIGLLAIPTAIRFHPRLDFWHNGQRLFTSGAMVAKIVNVNTGQSQGVHVTWIDGDGNKHPECPDGRARKMIGIAKDGCVRLDTDRNFAPTVRAVAEGLESALCFTSLFSVVCDAALSAGGMKNYRPTQGTEGVLIVHDNDKSGVGGCAGVTLAQRLSELGIKAAMKPSPSGSDWNDFVMGGGS